MLNRLLLISIFFQLYACSEVSIDDGSSSHIVEKIINGDLENNEASTVKIQLNGNPHCTGTLIKKNVVLTAGHCVALIENGQTLNFTQLGQLSVHVVINQNVTESANVIDAIMYPQWDGQSLFGGVDAALLYLGADLTPAPIALDNVDPRNRIGSLVKVVGYGLTEGNNRDSNPNSEKRAVTLKVDNVDADGRLLVLNTPDQQVRATCNGDSGGPIFAMSPQGQVVSGITSFGAIDCSQASYSTSVFHKIDWIQQNINGPVNGNKTLGGGNNGNPPNQGNPNDPNGGQGNLDCASLVQCLSQCQDQNCANNCFGQANDQARDLFSEVQDCATQNNCQDAQCVNQACQAQINACMNGGVGGGFPNDPNQGNPNDPNPVFPNDPNGGQGNLNCASLLQCLSQCQDQNCFNQCLQQADQQAINLFSDIQDCVTQNNCQDSQCVNQACQAQINACMNGGVVGGFPNDPNQGGAPLGCLDLNDCVSGCQDQQCAQDCLNMADPNAIQTLNAIYMCIAQSQCDQDDICIEDVCAAEIQACF